MPDPRLISDQSSVIERAELVRIVDAAASGITESTRTKMLAVARTTDAVAVGWFHCNGVHCPASQARRRNQSFMEAFDRAMAARFGLEVKDSDEFGPAFAPFVVTVVDSAVSDDLRSLRDQT